ncbi:MAG: hypothetical protein IPJ95_07635 [Gemmatimonadetes bacterium]|nr:hypothetical protein [Gemmatimonadota bacterium]
MIWAGLLRDSVQVAYDSAFRVKTQTVHGSSTVSFSYDRDGLLVGAGALRLGRSATHGLLLADTLGPVRGSDSYTTRDSLDGTLHQAFAYDSNGNRTSLTTALGTVSSSYDAQDRLTRSATSGGVVTLYAYGSNGELQTKTDSATGAQTRYQYDALGNLLTVVLPTGDSVEYLIDGQNRRVGRKLNGAVTHRWLYQNQLNPIAELDSTGAMVSRFVYGSRGNVPDYLVRGGAVYRLVTDHLGSVRAVVDTATGAVAQWTAYDAWGNVLADSGAGFQPFGFAGGLTDSATGLVRFGARDYDPAVGRWTAKDPIGLLPPDLALYAHVGSDPVNRIDPTGLSWFLPRDGEAALNYYRSVFCDPSASGLQRAAALGGGLFAALWTPDTWWKTSLALGGGWVAGELSAARSATSFFEGTSYSPEVLAKNLRDPIQHGFSESVHAFESAGRVSTFIGGDGAAYTSLEIPGGLRVGGRAIEGVFQFYKDFNGVITHRYFNPF